MSLRVQKFGGSSVSTVEQIMAIAQRITHQRSLGDDFIIVISAMGESTDELVKLSQQITSMPHRRELDMLLSTGERVSMALMSMALNSLNCPAISFTGSQAGIITDPSHTNAKIVDIRPLRLEKTLKDHQVVVLAGFQGVSERDKEITTLGRGGTDLTAVAMAAYFKAETCQIMKDVDGVYSADPRIVKSARHIPFLSYDQLLAMTFWGAQVLYYRSVELASRLGVPISIELAHGEGGKTLVTQERKVDMYENEQVLSVNSHNAVECLTIEANSASEAVKQLFRLIDDHKLSNPQILDVSSQGSPGRSSETETKTWEIYYTGPSETMIAISSCLEKRNAGEKGGKMTLKRGFATVSVTAQGLMSSSFLGTLVSNLHKNGINPTKMLFGPMTQTFVVQASECLLAIQILHG